MPADNHTDFEEDVPIVEDFLAGVRAEKVATETTYASYAALMPYEGSNFLPQTSQREGFISRRVAGHRAASAGTSATSIWTPTRSTKMLPGRASNTPSALPALPETTKTMTDARNRDARNRDARNRDALDARRPRQQWNRAQKQAYAKKKAEEELLQKPKQPRPDWMSDPSLLPKRPPGK